MDPVKLAKLQKAAAAAKSGGKGSARRKAKKVVKSAGADDKKLQATLKKFNAQPVGSIEEVNMFKASLAEDAEEGGAEEPKEHREVCVW